MLQFLERRGLPWLVFLLAIGLRLPAVFQELPPYLFCDEEMFAGETYRLYTLHTYRINEFRSGSMNIFPGLVAVRAADLFVRSPFSKTQVIIIGRLLYPVLLNSAAIFFLYAVTRRLFRSRAVAALSGMVYVFSPHIYAVSRSWYPDHFVAFAVSGFLYFFVKLFLGDARIRTFAALGLFWAITVSTKYTGLFLAIPVAYLFAYRLYRLPASLSYSNAFRRLVPGFAVLGFASVLAVLILNYNAILQPDKFISDWMFNIHHYNRTSGGFNVSGIAYYSVLVVGLTFGIGGFLFLFVGYYGIARKDRWLFALLLGFSTFYIVYMGKADVIINRNIIFILPFVLPIFAYGSFRTVVFVNDRTRIKWLLTAGVVLLLAHPVLQTCYSFVRDFRQDSRILANEWIRKHLDPKETVGHNEFCSGDSPAKGNGRALIFDPEMKRGLHYYVFNSYWDSTLHSAYTEKTFWQESELKYLQFYYFGDTKIWKREKNQGVEFYFPKGYTIEKKFSANGPEVVILKRQN